MSNFTIGNWEITLTYLINVRLKMAILLKWEIRNDWKKEVKRPMYQMTMDSNWKKKLQFVITDCWLSTIVSAILSIFSTLDFGRSIRSGMKILHMAITIKVAILKIVIHFQFQIQLYGDASCFWLIYLNFIISINQNVNQQFS
jgi:hypothetical protein